MFASVVGNLQYNLICCIILIKLVTRGQCGAVGRVSHSKLVLSLNPVKGSYCFLEQENLPSLLIVLVGFRNRLKLIYQSQIASFTIK